MLIQAKNRVRNAWIDLLKRKTRKDNRDLHEFWMSLWLNLADIRSSMPVLNQDANQQAVDILSNSYNKTFYNMAKVLMCLYS